MLSTFSQANGSSQNSEPSSTISAAQFFSSHLSLLGFTSTTSLWQTYKELYDNALDAVMSRMSQLQSKHLSDLPSGHASIQTSVDIVARFSEYNLLIEQHLQAECGQQELSQEPTLEFLRSQSVVSQLSEDQFFAFAAQLHISDLYLARPVNNDSESVFSKLLHDLESTSWNHQLTSKKTTHNTSRLQSDQILLPSLDPKPTDPFDFPTIRLPTNSNQIMVNLDTQSRNISSSSIHNEAVNVIVLTISDSGSGFQDAIHHIQTLFSTTKSSYSFQQTPSHLLPPPPPPPHMNVVPYTDFNSSWHYPLSQEAETAASAYAIQSHDISEGGYPDFDTGLLQYDAYSDFFTPTDLLESNPMLESNNADFYSGAGRYHQNWYPHDHQNVISYPHEHDGYDETTLDDQLYEQFAHDSFYDGNEYCHVSAQYKGNYFYNDQYPMYQQQYEKELKIDHENAQDLKSYSIENGYDGCGVDGVDDVNDDDYYYYDDYYQNRLQTLVDTSNEQTNIFPPQSNVTCDKSTAIGQFGIGCKAILYSAAQYNHILPPILEVKTSYYDSTQSQLVHEEVRFSVFGTNIQALADSHKQVVWQSSHEQNSDDIITGTTIRLCFIVPDSALLLFASLYRRQFNALSILQLPINISLQMQRIWSSTVLPRNLLNLLRHIAADSHTQAPGVVDSDANTEEIVHLSSDVLCGCWNFHLDRESVQTLVAEGVFSLHGSPYIDQRIIKQPDTTTNIISLQCLDCNYKPVFHVFFQPLHDSIEYLSAVLPNFMSFCQSYRQSALLMYHSYLSTLSQPPVSFNANPAVQLSSDLHDTIENNRNMPNIMQSALDIKIPALGCHDTKCNASSSYAPQFAEENKFDPTCVKVDDIHNFKSIPSFDQFVAQNTDSINQIASRYHNSATAIFNASVAFYHGVEMFSLADISQLLDFPPLKLDIMLPITQHPNNPILNSFYLLENRPVHPETLSSCFQSLQAFSTSYPNIVTLKDEPTVSAPMFFDGCHLPPPWFIRIIIGFAIHLVCHRRFQFLEDGHLDDFRAYLSSFQIYQPFFIASALIGDTTSSLLVDTCSSTSRRRPRSIRAKPKSDQTSTKPAETVKRSQSRTRQTHKAATHRPKDEPSKPKKQSLPRKTRRITAPKRIVPKQELQPSIPILIDISDDDDDDDDEESPKDIKTGVNAFDNPQLKIEQQATHPQQPSASQTHQPRSLGHLNQISPSCFQQSIPPLSSLSSVQICVAPMLAPSIPDASYSSACKVRIACVAGGTSLSSQLIAPSGQLIECLFNSKHRCSPFSLHLGLRKAMFFAQRDSFCESQQRDTTAEDDDFVGNLTRADLFPSHKTQASFDAHVLNPPSRSDYNVHSFDYPHHNVSEQGPILEIYFPRVLPIDLPPQSAHDVNSTQTQSSTPMHLLSLDILINISPKGIHQLDLIKSSVSLSRDVLTTIAAAFHRSLVHLSASYIIIPVQPESIGLSGLFGRSNTPDRNNMLPSELSHATKISSTSMKPQIVNVSTSQGDENSSSLSLTLENDQYSSQLQPDSLLAIKTPTDMVILALSEALTALTFSASADLRQHLGSDSTLTAVLGDPRTIPPDTFQRNVISCLQSILAKNEVSCQQCLRMFRQMASVPKLNASSKMTKRVKRQLYKGPKLELGGNSELKTQPTENTQPCMSPFVKKAEIATSPPYKHETNLKSSPQPLSSVPDLKPDPNNDINSISSHPANKPPQSKPPPRRVSRTLKPEQDQSSNQSCHCCMLSDPQQSHVTSPQWLRGTVQNTPITTRYPGYARVFGIPEQFSETCMCACHFHSLVQRWIRLIIFKSKLWGP